MLIQSLQLQNFRNYEDTLVEFDPKVNVLLGDNAQGKTNVLEAIYLLAVGKSHRTSKDQDLIARDREFASVTGKIERRNHLQKLSLYLGNKGKKAAINGITQTKMTDFVGHFQVVLFAPEDLQLVKGGPATRRRFVDIELGQIQVSYLYHLSQYQRVLQQRNVLLKQERRDLDLLQILNIQLAEHGAQVVYRRNSFIRELAEFAKLIYSSISAQGEILEVSYFCSIPNVNGHQLESLEQINIQYLKTLEDRTKADITQKYTTIGPHRDDLLLQLDGQPVQSFASQGQQRSIALALRLAEIDFMYRQLNEYPVLLLDDVLSELDNNRQKNLVLAMQEKVQTIITTTGLFDLKEKLGQHARLHRVRSGIINAEESL